MKKVSHYPLIPCIVGPTGAGKTAAALALAAELPIEVINADSRQVYKDFPIITAQPSSVEQDTCPHRLYGFLPTTDKMSAGAYARLASATIENSLATGKTPVLVGGTGLYFSALFDGIAPVPQIPHNIHEHWQTRCENEGSTRLYKELAEIDPEYAAKIHPNDRQRITRALEVWESTGKTFSWWHNQDMPAMPFKPLYIGIGLPMLELEIILSKRIQLMLDIGAIDEARTALSHCVDATAPGWSGIGCQELYLHLEGTLSLEECCNLWLKNTRAYAKRQNTWFKRNQAITWFRPTETDAIVHHVLVTWGG